MQNNVLIWGDAFTFLSKQNDNVQNFIYQTHGKFKMSYFPYLLSNFHCSVRNSLKFKIKTKKL